MTAFLDASVILALLIDESHSERAVAWLGADPGRLLQISGWVAAECASALSVRQRMGTLTAAERLIKDTRLAAFLNAATTEVDVIRADFHTAAAFAARADLNLRAGDALHLAVARRRDLELVTLDRRLAETGPLLGVRTRLP